jgi:hypothetical protein
MESWEPKETHPPKEILMRIMALVLAGTGSVLRGFGLGRDQAYGGSGEPGSIGFTKFSQLCRIRV